MTHQEAGQAAETAEAARLKERSQHHTLRTVQKLIVLFPHRKGMNGKKEQFKKGGGEKHDPQPVEKHDPQPVFLIRI
jgi:hypothetical protein